MSVSQPVASIEATVVESSAATSAIASGLNASVASTLPTESNPGSADLSEPASTKNTAFGDGPSCWLWLTKQDQTFATICVAIFLTLTGYHWAKLGGWGMQAIDVDRLPARQYDFRIDINSAGWVEWTQIEGIGQATANKIIADRETNGPFRTIHDLLRVKGIGPKTLEKMRPYLREPGSEVE